MPLTPEEAQVWMIRPDEELADIIRLKIQELNRLAEIAHRKGLLVSIQTHYMREIGLEFEKAVVDCHVYKDLRREQNSSSNSH